MKPCTITIRNAGRKLVHSGLRGAHLVTVLEIELKDDETGRVLNKHTSHSADGDTLTLKLFYDPDARPRRTEENIRATVPRRTED